MWFLRFQSEPVSECSSEALKLKVLVTKARLVSLDYDSYLEEIQCCANYTFIIEATGLRASAPHSDVDSPNERFQCFGASSAIWLLVAAWWNTASHGWVNWIWLFIHTCAAKYTGSYFPFKKINKINTIVWHFGKWNLFPITKQITDATTSSWLL